jgi:hypothetical protein
MMPTATEENLRWAIPVTRLARVATKEKQTDGKQIYIVELGLRFLAVAFGIRRSLKILYRRSPTSHLAYGKGEQFCAGAHLARLESPLIPHHLVPWIGQIELEARSNGCA